MNIYCGNMSFDMTEQQLREAFENYGEVTSVNIINDRETGRPRGFGFVEMANKDEAMAAIEALNGKELMGRTVTVNEARGKKEGGGGGRRRSW
ncbi:RNA-binding protein [candidate division GN15 bacterium]|jgi:RNA recognition motif-containing protein|nr:RNA-binding protein [candidate division GN15 bacterium]